MLAHIQNDFSSAVKKIYSINLTQVLARLVHIDKWSEEEAIIGCKQYKNFLILKLKYGNQYSLPPSRDIDDVWHAHILHTVDYVKFCNDIFGEYLHHHPHQDANLSDSIKKLIQLFEKQTQTLYFKEFGEYITNVRTIVANDDTFQKDKKTTKMKNK